MVTLRTIIVFCKTMFFHSLNDSRYIAELKQALIATGLQPKNPITREYRLKEEFKTGGADIFLDSHTPFSPSIPN